MPDTMPARETLQNIANMTTDNLESCHSILSDIMMGSSQETGIPPTTLYRNLSTSIEQSAELTRTLRERLQELRGIVGQVGQ